MELSRHLDETGLPTVCMLGLHQVCIKFSKYIVCKIQTSCLVWFLVQILCLVWTVCTKFAIGLHQNCNISWENLTDLKYAKPTANFGQPCKPSANFMQTSIVCLDYGNQFFSIQTLVNPSGPNFKTAFQAQFFQNSFPGTVQFFMLPGAML